MRASARELRWICKHDSFTVEGCVTCSAADEIDRLRAENEALRSIILWALGENGDFPDRPERVEGKPHPLYWWRTEMRKRLNAAMREQK